MTTSRLLDEIRLDVRHAVRQAWHRPLLTVLVVATVGLAVGLSATMFSTINAVLLRPLPYADADRLVRVVEHIPAHESMSGAAEQTATMDPELFAELRQQTRTLSHVALIQPTSMVLEGRQGTVRLPGRRVSASLLPMLRASPALGRTLSAADEVKGQDRAVVIGYQTWQTHFGGDAAAIGTEVFVEGGASVIVGVMPPDFVFPDAQTAFWMPLAPQPGEFRRFAVLARLQDGVAIQAAEQEIDGIGRRFRGEPPASGDAAGSRRMRVVRWQDDLVQPIRRALLVFVAAIASVLLIAGVNVANLFVARAITRQPEHATQFAIGATPGRIRRHLVTESLVLTGAGGLAGAGLAFAGSRLLAAFGEGFATMDRARLQERPTLPRFEEISVDTTVLLYTLAATVVIGLACGLLPATGIHRAGRRRPVVGLGTAGSADLRRVRAVMVTGQVALTMILLAGAGLLIRSFANLIGVDPGYAAHNVVTFRVAEPASAPADPSAMFEGQPRQLQLADAVVARLAAVDGVEGAAFTSGLPLRPMGFGLSLRSSPDGVETRIDGGKLLTVGPDYFRVMRIRLRAGRGFEAADRARERLVFVVNLTLARRYFGGQDPLGQTIHVSNGYYSGEIVGVVDDVRQVSLDAPAEPQLFMTPQAGPEYLPIEPGGLYFMARGRANTLGLVPSLRQAVREVNPNALLDGVVTLDQLLDNAVIGPRLLAALSGSLAAIALVLATVGIYGVLAYFVAERRREISIRVALGARPGGVLRLVMRQGMWMTGVGTVVGGAGGFALTRYLDRMLFELSPLDPATFAAAAVLFAAFAALASYIPARRASGIDPVRALKDE